MIKPEDLFKKNEPGDTLDRPLDHLVACHRRIEDRLTTLELIANHFQARRQEALAAASACFSFFDANGAWHTEDEEQSLFPRLIPLLNEEEREYLARLEAQHDEAEAVYAELKATIEEIAKGSTEAEARYGPLAARLNAIYRPHIASEDETLTAIGKRVLDADTLKLISAEMRRRRGLPVKD